MDYPPARGADNQVHDAIGMRPVLGEVARELAGRMLLVTPSRRNRVVSQ